MSSHYIFGETLNGACAIESLILFSGELDPSAVRPLFQSIEEEGQFSLEDGRARIAGHRPKSEARIDRFLAPHRAGRDAKYVIGLLDKTVSGEDALFVAFPNWLFHDQVARIFRSGVVLGAGNLSIQDGQLEVFGSSHSLRLEARPSDLAAIERGLLSASTSLSRKASVSR